jgi:hypothetical protein
MPPDTQQEIAPIRPEGALMGILALLIADHEARRGDGRRTAQAVLNAAGMTVEEIAAVTGTTAAGVRAVLKADMPKPLPAWFTPARDHSGAVA